MSYRDEARRALGRAKDELLTMKDDRLKYAALELRMAIESLTYDRALAYKDEFTEAEYDTWQPKKVMAVLLEIDANADKDSSIAIGEEPASGVPAPVMHSLGWETVLNMGSIKEHYDALGSYLHVQTVRQVKKGVKVPFGKVRQRCDTIAAYLSKVLASPVWNSTFGQFASFDCECGARVRRRLPFEPSTVQAKCLCGWQYEIESQADGQFVAKPKGLDAKCAQMGCDHAAFVPTHLAKAGSWWTCEECGGRNEIRLGLVYQAPDETAGGTTEGRHPGSMARRAPNP